MVRKSKEVRYTGTVTKRDPYGRSFLQGFAVTIESRGNDIIITVPFIHDGTAREAVEIFKECLQLKGEGKINE